MLSDHKTYKVLKKDPTRCTERRLNAQLLKLKKDEKIFESLYLQLRSSDGVSPRFYGLPKIHKPGYPLRPIVFFIDSRTYNTSKHIAKILSPLVGNTDYTVRNSKEFCASLEQVKLEQDVELVSFDVVSLFTSIPVEHAVQVAESKLSQDETLQSRSAIPITDIVYLLKFCLSSTNFKYNNIHYQQIFGCAMGSPVSRCYGYIVMENLEQKAIFTSLTVFLQNNLMR